MTNSNLMNNDLFLTIYLKLLRKFSTTLGEEIKI